MALLSFCVHLLPLDAGLVLSQESLPFTRGERAKRKGRFVPAELASCLLTFPLGWLHAVADSQTPRRGAGGAVDPSEGGVRQAEICYLAEMHLAARQLHAEGF